MSKIQCCVPFCPRFVSKYPEGNEVICAGHFKLVDTSLKRLRTRIRRRAERLKMGKQYRQGFVHVRILRADHTDDLIWQRMKRQAIERAAGIA